MRGIIGNPERSALSSDSRRVEQGGARERKQFTQKGGLKQMDDNRTGFEGIGFGEIYQARVTEHLVGAGGQARGSTSGSEAGERGSGDDIGDEAGKGNTYLVWRGLRHMGDGGGE